MSRCLPLICLLTICIPGPGWSAEPQADRRWLPEPELQPDPQIPTLHKLIGHRWGEDITSHAEMERYLKALAKAAPDRTALVPYGTTYEGRRLYYLVIASPENLQRREEIRAAHLQLANQMPALTWSGFSETGDPDQPTVSEDQMPAIVWLAYGIHGNETSGTEAALLTAYHLLADQRPQTRQLLNNVIVLIDPLQNPDGHERFVNVYRETRGVFPDAEPLASEHTERWPGGRFNHYLFDMNRDWFLQSQRESQARAAAYLQWLPQIYADVHEMGYNANYFFSPKAEPTNPFFLPAQVQTLQRLGRHQAQRFDELGFPYTTREMFEAFYPGYGSTWPIYQGGLALLWEQAGVRGLVIRRDDQQLLHFHQAVRHHYVSSLATIEFAAAAPKQLVQEFYQARRRSIQGGHEGPIRHYFLPPGSQPLQASALARLLRNNGVRVQRVSEPLQATCTDARNQQKQKRQIPAGSYHIDLAQPAGRLARVLLERQVEMPREFVERQLQRNRDRFPDEIYDVTAWSLPLAWGVDCWSAEAAEVKGEPWDGEPPAGAVTGGRAQAAYLIADQHAALPALASWLRQGLRVHVADRQFELGGAEYPAGTLILRTHQNPPRLHAAMQRAAEQFHLQVVASDSTLTSAGAQLGGPHVRWVEPPKVALLVDRPAGYTVGHTWYLFDHVLRYPVTRVAASNLSRLKLSDFNVLVLPDGDYSGRDAPGEKEIGRLRQWVSEGGTLILIKRAAGWATNKSVGLLSVQPKKKPAPESPDSSTGAGKADESQPAESPDPAPGAFLRARVFAEHWLTFGCPETIDVFYQGNLMFPPPAPAKGRGLVNFLPAAEVLTSGFCWPETLELVGGTSYLVHEPLGAGHVIGFADDPNYRAMYPLTQRLFSNAILFGPGH